VIAYLLGGAAAAFLVLLAVAGTTGRARPANCCSTADPARGARVRDLDPHEPRREAC
jgi:hypothetical protein